MMNAAKKDFYTNCIAENSMDQGRLFRDAKKLLAKKEVPSFPGYTDKSVLVNDIGKFFIRKIESIRSDINNAVNSRANMVLPEDSEVGPEKALLAFHPLSEDEKNLVHLIQLQRRLWSPVSMFYFRSLSA